MSLFEEPPTRVEIEAAQDALSVADNEEIPAIQLLRQYNDLSLRRASDAVRYVLGRDARVRIEAVKRLAGEG